MSDDDQKSDEWDRMSLNSLKRELEVQKAKTEMARDEAKDRIRDKAEEKSGRSWLWIVGAIVIVVRRRRGDPLDDSCRARVALRARER